MIAKRRMPLSSYCHKIILLLRTKATTVKLLEIKCVNVALSKCSLEDKIRSKKMAISISVYTNIGIFLKILLLGSSILEL
jgi:hypothetical protein